MHVADTNVADTNVVVRFLAKDDPVQSPKSAELFFHHRVLLLKSVLLETEWVLRAAAGLRKSDIARALNSLVRMTTVELEDPSATMQALELFEAGMDFADAMHVSSIGEAEAFVTFDRKLAKSAGKANLTKVRLL